MPDPKISAETIVRTIVLIVALINQTLTSMGKNPLPYSDSVVYEAATIVVTVCASLWAWWKNNSFTREAIKADGYMRALKSLREEPNNE